MSYSTAIYYALTYALLGLCCVLSGSQTNVCFSFISSFSLSAFLLDRYSTKILPRIIVFEAISALVILLSLGPDLKADYYFNFTLIKVTSSVALAYSCYRVLSLLSDSYNSIYDSMTSLLKYCTAIALVVVPTLIVQHFYLSQYIASPVHNDSFWFSFLYSSSSVFGFFFSYAVWHGISIKYNKGILDFSKLLLALSLSTVCAYLYVTPEFRGLRPMTVFPIVIWSCLILGSVYMACYFSVFVFLCNTLQFQMYRDLPPELYANDDLENLAIIVSVFLISSTCTVFLRDNNSLRLKLRSEMARNYEHNKNAALNKMAGSIAHEINNPLSIILGYSQMLRKLKEEGRLTEEFLGSTTSKIMHHSDRIHLIVKSMQELDKKVSFKDGAKGFDPDVFLKNLNFNYADTNLQLLSSNSIVADINYPSEELSFVLDQLIDNAVYFSGQNTKPAITVDLHQTKECFVFEVKDNGEGISGILAQSIYEPFVTTKKNKNSAGLGLSLTYNLIKAFNGDISHFRSKEGLTVFKIDLPIIT